MKLNRFYYLIFLWSLIPWTGLSSQDIPILDKYVDSNYVDYVKSVQVRPLSSEYNLQRPIVDLQPKNNVSSSRLNITFDVLGDHDYTYYFTIVHCDKDWQPTELQRNELISGFDYLRLDNRHFSRNTYQQYIRYNFQLPTQDMRWLVSGNYMLLVYLLDPMEVVFTRKFIVSENILRSKSKPLNASFSGSMNQNQSFEFETEIPEGVRLDNPRNNTWLTMYQNMEIYGEGPLSPRNTYGNTIIWNAPGTLEFPASKEWRLHDTRSLRSRRSGLAAISDNSDSIFVRRYPDRMRFRSSRDTYEDLNGGWLVKNQDDQYSNGSSEDYALTEFSLKAETPFTKDIYLVGNFSNYKCLPAYRMEYDEGSRSYKASAYLIQGVHDYKYATGKPGVPPNYADLEGNDFGTFNKYYGVIYYRSFVGRYDRVIGHYCFQFQCPEPTRQQCGCH